MKRIVLFLSVSALVLFTYVLLNRDSQLVEPLTIVKESAEVQANHAPNKHAQYYGFQCPAELSVIVKEIQFNQSRKNELQRKYAGLYAYSEPDVSEGDKELNIQLLDISLASYRETMLEIRSFNNTLNAVSLLQTTPPLDVFELIYAHILLREYEKIVELVESGQVNSHQNFLDRSLLSFIIENDSNISQSQLEALISSGLTPQFPDLVTATSIGLSENKIALINAYFDGSIEYVWYDNLHHSSLATLAIEKNNAQLFNFWYQLGSPVSVGKAELNGLDLIRTPSNDDEINNALLIFDALMKTTIIPYDINTLARLDSWLPLNVKEHHQQNIERIKAIVADRISQAKPANFELNSMILDKLSEFSTRISQGKEQLRVCEPNHEYLREELVTAARSISYPTWLEGNVVAENLSRFDLVPVELKTGLIELQRLITNKQWTQYISRLNDITQTHDIAPYKSVAVVQLIAADAPLLIIEEILLQEDVVVVPQTLAMAILNNNIALMELLIPHSLEIQLESSNDFFADESNGSLFIPSPEMEKLLVQRRLLMSNTQ